MTSKEETARLWKQYYSNPENAERYRQKKRATYASNLAKARARQREKEAVRYADPTKRRKIIEAVRKYRDENKDLIVERRRVRRALLRKEVIDALGGCCTECGESRVEFLAVDHVMKDGSLHRRSVGKDSVYRDIKRLGFPSDRFRVLCHNHNEGTSRRTEVTSKAARHYRRLRERLLNGLGGACECCGETDQRFLCLDHVEGKGIDHYRSLGPMRVYREVIAAGFPRDKFRALCFNCNKALGSYGKCPHEQARCHA